MSGYIYEKGLGTSKNLIEAKRLYAQAIKQGYTEAKTRLYLMSDKGQREIAKNKRTGFDVKRTVNSRKSN